MFCENCGSKVPNGSIFCTSCGTKLGKAAQQAAKTQNDAQNELERANADAASVVNAANAEAAKIAREFVNSIETVQASDNSEQTGSAAMSLPINVDINDRLSSDKPVNDTESVSKKDNLSDIEKPEENLLPVQNDDLTSTENNDLALTENNALASTENNALTIKEDAAEAVVKAEEQSTALQNKEEKEDGNGRVNVNKQPSKEIKEGKSIPAGLLIAASIGLVVIVIALVFICSGSARNSIKRTFMSDENYFKSVEKNAITDIVDDLSIAYEDDLVGLFDFMKSDYALSVDVDVKDEAEDFLEAIYKKNRDLDLSWIKQANAEAEFQIKDKMVRLNGEASVNKKDLFDFDLIGNLNDNKFFIGIPILNKEYAKFDFSNAVDVETMSENAVTADTIMKLIDAQDFQDALPTKKELRKIVDRYVDIVLNKIDKIKFYEDQKLEAAGVKERYLMISVDLSDSKQPEIYDAILKELSKDDEVLAIINRIEKTGVFGDKVTADAFLNWIEKEQDEVYERTYPFRTLNVWVDSTGKVVGHQIVDEAGTGMTYKYVINGDNFGFEAYEARKGMALQNITASGTISGSSVSGNVKYYKNGSEKISLDFLDIDVTDLMRGNPTGSLVLDVYDMWGQKQFRGLKLTVEFELALKKSTVKMLLSDAGKTIIEADILLKKSSSGKIKEPSKVLDIDKNNNIFTWIRNFDWDTVLKNADKSNMPSRYYRQLEKWSESDLSEEINKLNSIIQKYSIRGLTVEDLYIPIGE